ncbi:LysR family transcriptional regulator [Micromonospora sp. DT227]|uniref:LysR family transcriptional regulator n=1 Tax=Micromonospora sp. DT227 TaxID=3393433 RepID=UPI003CED6936
MTEPGSALPWGMLHTIGVVSTTSSMTRAAELLRVSQPALSRRVNAAEQLAGTDLFDRTGSGVQVTAAGRALADAARRMAGPLRAATAPPVAGPPECAFATYVTSLGELVRWFSQRWPASRWHGAELRPELAMADLAQGALDIFLGVHTLHHAPVAASVRRHVAVRDPLRLAMSTRHPLAANPVLTLAELRHEPWLTSNDPAVEQLLVEACRGHGFHPRIAYRTDRTRSIRDLVAGGHAVTLCVPVARTDDEVVVRPVIGLPSLDLVVAWNPERLPAALADRFCGVLIGWYLSRAWSVPAFRSWLDAHYAEVISAVTIGVDEAGDPDPARDVIDWNDLQAAFEVLRTGSAPQAASRLGCSPSTVQRRLHRLERQVGDALLERSAEGRPEPTVRGFLLLHHLYRAQAARDAELTAETPSISNNT